MIDLTIGITTFNRTKFLKECLRSVLRQSNGNIKIIISNDNPNRKLTLKNLDLFITVSNSTAHLAGSLGVKTLLIKPKNHAVFHYWNQPGNITPWYKSINFIEKNEYLNEENVINRYLDI